MRLSSTLPINRIVSNRENKHRKKKKKKRKKRKLHHIISEHQAHHVNQSTKLLPVETRVAFAVEDNESAEIPLDLNHHSGHCPSFPPLGQKQFSIVCPSLPAALQMGFSQTMFDFRVAIKAVGWITEVLISG